MLSIHEIKPSVWEITLKGVVDKSDIQKMESVLTPALEGKGPIGLVLRAEEWRDITADAIAEDVKFELGMISQWSKVARMAMVTDVEAFGALLRWVDPILPMIAMKSFGSADIDAAKAFAGDLPDSVAEDAASGVTLLTDGADGLIAYEIHGRITSEDVDKVLAPLAPHLQGEDKIDLLVRFKSYEGFDPAILMNGGLIGSKISAMTHLRRYAIIGAPEWIKTMVLGVAPMMPFEMRVFDSADDAAAWTWVRGT